MKQLSIQASTKPTGMNAVKMALSLLKCAKFYHCCLMYRVVQIASVVDTDMDMFRA